MKWKWKERKIEGKKSFGVHKVYNLGMKKKNMYKQHTETHSHTIFFFRLSASKFLNEIENNCLFRVEE